MKRRIINLSESQERHENSWQEAYGDFCDVVNQKKLKYGVEVGVAFGGHCKAILDSCMVTRLVGVDSYRHRSGYKDPMNLPQPKFDELHQRTCDRLAVYGERFRLIRKDSLAAAEDFSRESVDFVYLDADHSKEGLWKDLTTWFFVVREGGVLAGHDYGHPDFAGVKEAVDRFFGRFGWSVQHRPSGVWWVEKKPLPITYFIPAYNSGRWIAEVTDSVLKGNMVFEEGDELVIVDDGSTDDTFNLIQEIADKHAGVRVIAHEKNKGGGAARNTAVSAAHTPLCFCLDSDNVLVANSVNRLRDHLIRNDVDSVAFQEIRYFSDDQGIGRPTHSWVFNQSVTDLRAFLRTNMSPGSSGNYLFTKESWGRAGGYPETVGALDAWGFALRTLATGSKITVLPNSFYFHRYGHDSYWVRHNTNGTIDQAATNLIEPYLDMLAPADARYVLSAKGRKSWFSRLRSRPLRLRGFGNYIEPLLWAFNKSSRMGCKVVHINQAPVDLQVTN